MRILDPIVLQSPALLPAAIGAIAFQKKAAVYDLMFRTAAETLTTIAAHPKHLGARIGLTAVLHTWGSAPTHHPHVHIIAPGGGMSPDSSRWQSRKRISWSLRRGAQWGTTASSQLVARAYAATCPIRGHLHDSSHSQEDYGIPTKRGRRLDSILARDRRRPPSRCPLRRSYPPV
jgi:hypothetical protein